MPNSLETRMTIPTVSDIASPFIEHSFETIGRQRHCLTSDVLRKVGI